MSLAILIVVVIVLLVLLRAIRLTQEWRRAVVLRLGRFHAVKGPGLYLVLPVIDQVAFIIDMRIQTTSITAERALTRHGYTVITADNGEDALQVLAKGEPIDLLISDVVMPGMDGPTMVREARESRPELKILFMSGYAEEQLRKSIDIENVNFLPKPFSVTELAEAARRAAGAK